MFSRRCGCFLLLALAAARPCAAQSGDKYALLVGVREYSEAKELRPLPYTENDVTELAAVLQDNGFKRDNIVLMTQARGAAEIRYLPLEQRIRKELHLLLQGRQAEDVVVLAFAGHGVNLKGDKESYFCPADAQLNDKTTLLSLKFLYGELENCKAGMRVLLVDACRNDPFVDKSRARPEVDLESVTRPDLPAPPTGVAAFFSCSEKEKAYEADKFRHGVFFNYVIEGLRGEAANKSGDVSVLGLSDYVSGRVKDFVRVQYGVSQKPDLKVVGNNAEIPLVRQGKLFGKWQGQYVYPKTDTRPPVSFEMRLGHSGKKITGSTKEPNTFWKDNPDVDRNEPNLFAGCNGSFDESTGRVTWTKTYDGTARVSHSVEYRGSASQDGTKIEGTYTVRTPGRPDFNGTFTMRKLAREQ